jgi:hypothetical protein
VLDSAATSSLEDDHVSIATPAPLGRRGRGVTSPIDSHGSSSPSSTVGYIGKRTSPQLRSCWLVLCPRRTRLPQYLPPCPFRCRQCQLHRSSFRLGHITPQQNAAHPVQALRLPSTCHLPSPFFCSRCLNHQHSPQYHLAAPTHLSQ